MAQHDYDIANAAGATVRADINNVLAAIVSLNSGASAPSTTIAGMWWYDSTNDILKKRNEANSAFIELIHFDQTNGLFRIDFDKGADIASAATTDIGAATGNYVVVTGTTTITALGTIKAGTHRLVRFAGILTLTHNATSLILPTGANITTAADDTMLAVSEGGGNWRVLLYQRKLGPEVAGGTAGQVLTSNGAGAAPTMQTLAPGLSLETEQATTSGSSKDFTGISSTAKRITIMFEGVSLSGTDDLLVQIGDSGGIEATGYVSSAVRINASPNIVTSTAGFNVFMQEAGALFSGHMVLTNISGDGLTWIASHSGKKTTANTVQGGSDKTLSATLDRVRITRSGTNTFDAGSVNILVE